jgi:hypothetical protein
MTQEALAQEIAAQLHQNIPVQEIREAAAAKGFSPEQVRAALDDAHTLVQQQSDKDPTIRIVLGPALLIVAFVAFYADWVGRSVGPGTIIGVLALLIGGRLVWSLLKQWSRKRS